MCQDTAAIETVAFSVEEVGCVPSQIKPDKSPGPEEIPKLILKELSTELLKPLSTLFELSMRTGRLPSQWKTANLVPLHKLPTLPHQPLPSFKAPSSSSSSSSSSSFSPPPQFNY
ncbi:hypothetical protein SprV_0100247800 [Sparganum proliferum]